MAFLLSCRRLWYVETERLRFPHTRREQFRQYEAFSTLTSLLGAAAILALCILMILAQGAWQSR